MIVLAAFFAVPALGQDSCAAIDSRLAAIENTPSIANLAGASDLAALASTRLADAQAQYNAAGCATEALSGGLGSTCRVFAQAVLQAQADLGQAQRDASASRSIANERSALLDRHRQLGCGSGVSFWTNGEPSGGVSLFDGGFSASTSEGFLPEAGLDLRGTRRTLCVRTCDGYYWPVSFATTQSYMAQDAQICRAQCPGTDVQLYSHATEGEDVADMVSGGGLLYSRQPFAFAFQDEDAPACGCTLSDAGLTPIGRSGTYTLPSAAPIDLVDIPLPMPRPVFPGEEPVAEAAPASVPPEDLRLYQFGDETIRVVGPVTPFAQEAEAAP